MADKSMVLVDIHDNLDIVASEQPLMSVEEVIKQYPDLTKVSKMIRFDKTRMLDQLKKVIGQQDNIRVVADAINTWIRKRKKTRPLVFMFAGTSGTGKTYTAKIISSSLEEDGYQFVRLNMNEYHSEADSWKFLGSSTGYSGSTEDSPIFAARKSSDKLVILIDEVEKAHPNLFTLFMGLMDEGILANGRGQQYDFCQSIIIFTTNEAMDQLLQAKQKLQQMEIPITDVQFQSEAKNIYLDNASQLTDTGIAGLSVVSAIMSSDNPKKSSEELLNIFNS